MALKVACQGEIIMLSCTTLKYMHPGISAVLLNFMIKQERKSTMGEYGILFKNGRSYCNRICNRAIRLLLQLVCVTNVYV